MSVNQPSSNTFENFLLGIFNLGDQSIEPKTPRLLGILPLTALFAVLGFIYKVINYFDKTDDGTFAIWCILLNLVVLIFGIIAFDKYRPVDCNETQKKFTSSHLGSKPRQIGFNLYVNNDSFQVNCARANTFTERFFEFFSFTLWASLILYFLILLQVAGKKINKPDGITHRTWKEDSLILDRMDFRANQLKSITLSKDKEVLYVDTIQVKFSQATQALDNIYMLAYNSHNGFFAVANSTANIISVAWMLACYLILFEHSKSSKIPKKRNRHYVLVILVVFWSASHYLLRSGFLSISNIQNVGKIDIGYKIISGLLNATVFGLLLSKFTARHLRPPIWLMSFLFLYAAIQTLFFVMDFTLFDNEYFLLDTITCLCLFAKCLLFLYLYWLKYSNRLFQYFFVYPKTIQIIDSNADEFNAAIEKQK